MPNVNAMTVAVELDFGEVRDAVGHLDDGVPKGVV